MRRDKVQAALRHTPFSLLIDHCDERNVAINSGLFFLDGERYAIYIKTRRDGRFCLTDGGRTLERVGEDFDWLTLHTGVIGLLLERMLVSLGAVESNQHLVLDTTEETLHQDLLSFCQLVTRVDSLSILNEE